MTEVTKITKIGGYTTIDSFMPNPIGITIEGYALEGLAIDTLSSKEAEILRR